MSPTPFPVRRIAFFRDSQPLARHWFGGNAYLTHRSNALTLLFPRGEEFFVRSVRDALYLIKDPQLHRQATLFAAQEGQHARAHREHFDLLRNQGFEIDGLLARLTRRLDWVDANLPMGLRLAVTAASEHITAIVAREVLGRENDPLEGVDPRVRNLFRWHALEELEHKAVAFNVMKAANVSHLVRVAGAVIAFSQMLLRWRSVTRMLCKQDGVSEIEMRSQKRRAIMRGIEFSDREFVRRFVPYLSPNYHPDDVDDHALIAKVEPEFEYGVASRPSATAAASERSSKRQAS